MAALSASATPRGLSRIARSDSDVSPTEFQTEPFAPCLLLRNLSPASMACCALARVCGFMSSAAPAAGVASTRPVITARKSLLIIWLTLFWEEFVCRFRPDGESLRDARGMRAGVKATVPRNKMISARLDCAGVPEAIASATPRHLSRCSRAITLHAVTSCGLSSHHAFESLLAQEASADCKLTSFCASSLRQLCFWHLPSVNSGSPYANMTFAKAL